MPDCSLISPMYAEYVLLNLFLTSEAANLNPPLNIPLPDPVPYSVNEPLKIFLTDYPSG